MINNEKQYLEQKKKNIIKLVNEYNKEKPDELKVNIREENLDIEQTFTTIEKCKKCGKCCNYFPCIFSVGDFIDITNIDYMENILNTGLLCIAKTKAGNYVIRPRGIMDGNHISGINIGMKVPRGYKNRCLLLSKNGCMLDSIYRPSEGLLYIRDNDKHIIIYDSKIYNAEYSEYQDILINLYEKYKFHFFGLDRIEESTSKLTKKLIDYNYKL